MKKSELKPFEYNDYLKRYIDKIDDNTELKKGFEDDKKMVIAFFSSLPKEKLDYRYLPKKWSIKEILQHIIDTERIFMYRLLRISRKDSTALMGYDQDIFIKPSQANTKTLEELMHEFTVTRLYSCNLLQSISDKNLLNMGTVSDSPISARACAFILLGHSIWHMNIIKERYL